MEKEIKIDIINTKQGQKWTKQTKTCTKYIEMAKLKLIYRQNIANEQITLAVVDRRSLLKISIVDSHNMSVVKLLHKQGYRRFTQTCTSPRLHTLSSPRGYFILLVHLDIILSVHLDFVIILLIHLDFILAVHLDIIFPTRCTQRDFQNSLDKIRHQTISIKNGQE